jgi:hypothetical protein
MISTIEKQVQYVLELISKMVSVIPAKAGIHNSGCAGKRYIPNFSGVSVNARIFISYRGTGTNEHLIV